VFQECRRTSPIDLVVSWKNKPGGILYRPHNKRLQRTRLSAAVIE
jgi:hypothetical protein